MFELEVYPAGLRDLDKILELDHQPQPGLPRARSTDDHIPEIRAIFRKLALDPHFIGSIPAELRPKGKRGRLMFNV